MEYVRKAFARVSRLGARTVVLGSGPTRGFPEGFPKGEGLTVDFYHVAEEREDPAIVVAAAPHVRHVHFANPQGRVFPARPEEYDYRRFFDSLRAIGYAGRISIEARAADFGRDAPRAIAFLRSALLP
jgi:sugar phosphate isomerase/epimerase